MNTRQVQAIQIRAVVTRADGTVENLGVITRWHRNPLRRLWWRMRDRTNKWPQS